MRLHLLAAATVLLAVPTAFAQGIPADLTTWSQKGPAGNGNWNVSADSSSVLQTSNQQATFFVSPSDVFNTTVNGSFGVGTTTDNDYIGFVFGYQTPAGTGTDYDFLLFSWKRGLQNGDPAGFVLSKVDCGNCLGFGQYNEDRPADGYTILEENTGTGWAVNQDYNFSLLYTADSVRVGISGGTFGAGQTIFAVDAADAGLASFPSGKFGFFNHSQANVRYSGFVQNNPPVAVDDPVSVVAGESVTFNVLDNDLDGDPLTLESFTSPLNGMIADNGGGSLTYEPFPGTTSDSFTYVVTDGELTDEGTVTITVTPAPPTGGLTGSIAAGTCTFPRPSATSRCFVQLTGTNGLDTAQRYTVFLRIVGTGGPADGFTRKVAQGEVKIGPGGTATNRMSLRTKGSDPDGQYDLVLVAEAGSVSAVSGAAFEVDRIPFTKGGGAGLRALPSEAALTLRGANPSDGRTALELALPADEQVTVLVYDALGRRVAELFGGAVEAGYTDVAVDLTRLPAGAYVVRAQGETFAKTLRLTVVR